MSQTKIKERLAFLKEEFFKMCEIEGIDPELYEKLFDKSLQLFGFSYDGQIHHHGKGGMEIFDNNEVLVKKDEDDLDEED